MRGRGFLHTAAMAALGGVMDALRMMGHLGLWAMPPDSAHNGRRRRRGVDSLHRAARHDHRPHQNQREHARRLRQIAAGQITFHDITPTGTEKGKSFARAARRWAERGRP